MPRRALTQRFVPLCTQLDPKPDNDAQGALVHRRRLRAGGAAGRCVRETRARACQLAARPPRGAGPPPLTPPPPLPRPTRPAPPACAATQAFADDDATPVAVPVTADAAAADAAATATPSVAPA